MLEVCLRCGAVLTPPLSVVANQNSSANQNSPANQPNSLAPTMGPEVQQLPGSELLDFEDYLFTRSYAGPMRLAPNAPRCRCADCEQRAAAG